MKYIFSKKSIPIIFVILGVVFLIILISKKEKIVQKEIPKQEIVQEVQQPNPEQKNIGSSVEGRPIESYTFGTGTKHISFIGGIHGGYEWNSVLLAYEFIDYFTENPTLIPDSLKVTIIPSANPDGVFKVVGKEGKFTLAQAQAKDPGDGTGRFNANNVDLNRNFDCKWQPESMWRSKVVSAGKSAFSEPESRAIRDFLKVISPEVVVFFHSQSNAVYASECENGILPQTLTIMNLYAKAAGYKAVSSFDAYPITGDAEGWLASIGIPSITVELQSHTATDWKKNLAGVEALLKYYAK